MTVAVCSVARTAVSGCDGGLAGWHPVELAGRVGRAALDRAGISASDLDEVVVGCADPVGANGADVARAVVLAAGWPFRVGGHVVDRAACSGTAALQSAASAILAGHAGSVLVIGLGLSSVVPPGAASVSRTYGMPWQGVEERLAGRGGLLPAPRVAEQAAALAGVTRRDMDGVAERSLRRRRAARASPAVVEVAARSRGRSGGGRGRSGGRRSGGGGDGGAVAADEIRRWGEPSALPPVFCDDGMLTAATFAPPADAVAAVLLRGGPPVPVAVPASPGAVPASRSGTERQGRLVRGRRAAPLAVIAGIGRAAGDPFDPTGGAERSVRQALGEAGIGLECVHELAVVEPDAATVLMTARSLDVDPERLNPVGGALATGNAGPAEELRLVTDGLAGGHAGPLASGSRLLTVSVGPGGSAAIVWEA